MFHSKRAIELLPEAPERVSLFLSVELVLVT